MPAETRLGELLRYLDGCSTPVAVSDLATRFGVTVRTILRDVENLRKQGHEISGARGRGGGISLVHRSETPPSLSLLVGGAVANTERPDSLRRPVFVGREAELKALSDAFVEVKAGQGRVVMLAGEPGIGKTGVVSHISEQLVNDGAQLYWGRCYESEGALPYWPWVQVIGTYATSCAPDVLRAEMGDGAPDITEMVPELNSALPGLERPSMSDTPEAARFRLFRSIAGFFSRASQKAPMALILEDLHWGDRSSLLLLEFLAQELESSPVLLIGTYRDVELNRRHPLGQTLAELNRRQHFLRMTLRGLEEQEVGRIIALASGHEPSQQLVTSLHGQTEGNPLFVTEMVNLLLDEGSLSEDGAVADSLHLGRVPEGVREAIGRRLDRLSDAANAVLRVASVMGRQFTIQQARRLTSGLSDSPVGTGFDEETEILPALEEALRARIIERDVDEIGAYQFTHSMIRDTLYDELSTPERVRLHRLAGEVIEVLHASNLDPHLSQLAHHFLEASQGGHTDRAVYYAERAGDRAVDMVAYEEGSRLYGMAIQALQLSERPDDLKRCELMNVLGRSQMLSGAIVEARETQVTTTEIARRIGAFDLQAEAAIAFETAGWHPGLDGSPAVELLVGALEDLDQSDSRLRARTMGSLGRALGYSGRLESALDTGRSAIEMARRLGDPTTLATTLWARLPARQDPSDIHQRVEFAREAIAICEELGRYDMALDAQAWLFNDLLELGEVDQVDPVLASWSAKVMQLRIPVWQVLLRSVETGNAFRLGHFDEAEQLADSIIEMSRGVTGLDVAGVHGATRFAIRREQGRLDEVRQALEVFLKLSPSSAWRPGLALLYAELDMREQARQQFELVAEDEFAGVIHDSLFTTTAVYMADVCCYLGDRDRAAELYRLLLPYEGHNISIGVGHVFLGPISRYMGSLATLMENWDDAERHFVDALTLARKSKSPPQEAHTGLEYALLLISRRKPGDVSTAVQMLEHAGTTANELGMRTLKRQVEEAFKTAGQLSSRL
jgi:tetratricopeptide (TPR) repeat protein